MVQWTFQEQYISEYYQWVAKSWEISNIMKLN